MPIADFTGKTFVAFADISGFKIMMRKRAKALSVLNRFYNLGYKLLEKQRYDCKVEGIFISDSGILFVRGDNPTCQFEAILGIVKEINKEMLKNDIMLTTSIAYGEFKYQNRIEFRGIEKNYVYGNAYVDAFLDSESGRPKIQPGQCRIVKENLPNEIENAIKKGSNGMFKFVKERRRDRNHYYFYWNCKTHSEIEKFEKNYSNARRCVYDRYLKALKGEYWIK